MTSATPFRLNICSEFRPSIGNSERSVLRFSGAFHSALTGFASAISAGTPYAPSRSRSSRPIPWPSTGMLSTGRTRSCSRASSTTSCSTSSSDIPRGIPNSSELSRPIGQNRMATFTSVGNSSGHWKSPLGQMGDCGNTPVRTVTRPTCERGR